MADVPSNKYVYQQNSFPIIRIVFVVDSFLSERRGENDEVENLSQQGSLLQSIHQGVATGRSSILAMSQKWPSNGSIMTATGNTSQWLAPPPNLRQDLRRLGLEYTAADMSLSALYMHELHHRSTLNSHTSSRRGYPPPGGNVAIPGNTSIYNILYLCTPSIFLTLYQIYLS